MGISGFWTQITPLTLSPNHGKESILLYSHITSTFTPFPYTVAIYDLSYALDTFVWLGCPHVPVWTMTSGRSLIPGCFVEWPSAENAVKTNTPTGVPL